MDIGDLEVGFRDCSENIRLSCDGRYTKDAVRRHRSHSEVEVKPIPRLRAPLGMRTGQWARQRWMNRNLPRNANRLEGLSVELAHGIRIRRQPHRRLSLPASTPSPQPVTIAPAVELDVSLGRKPGHVDLHGDGQVLDLLGRAGISRDGPRAHELGEHADAGVVALREGDDTGADVLGLCAEVRDELVALATGGVQDFGAAGGLVG